MIKHNERVNKKMNSLERYQDFLKLVSNKNPDEFTELGDILLRHLTLETTNKDLREDLTKSQDKIEELVNKIDNYQKSMGDKTVKA